jgi:ABC-type polysaccharide/polyol phosphate transport system ATPase subunit
MQVRLAYSIAIQVDFDILLLDEVLAVGDQAFQEKCVATFDRLRAEGKTILLVSHDMNAITTSCDRAALVYGGSIAAIGNPQEVVETYLDLAHAAAPVVAG